MRPDQWDRVQELFDRALELPQAERPAFLERESPDDTQVVTQVRSLLGYPTDELITPARIAAALGDDEPLAVPREIDGYRILGKLGEGGMGVVYHAEQQRPVRRSVALKLVRSADSSQIVSRFKAEQQALALMSHAYVARVYDAGVTEDGQPYFVMEYVPGLPVTQYCDEHALGLRQRLELFIRICEGIHHAHQKGIIHRDIKPSNVLVGEQDGRPVPKIIDFGIAKATGRHSIQATNVTEIGQVVGTLAYMSPEQARFTGHDIDTRTDVYSLGVLLYELLVGALPFDVTDERVPFDEICRRIREDDPPRPSERKASRRELRGDLDWIVMKALDKDRTRRYESVSELAADIRRYLGQQPVTARPPGAAYRLGKFVRRHRWGVASATLLLLALVAGIVATSLTMLRALEAERESTSFANYLVEVFRAPREGRARGESISAVELLDAKAAAIRDELDEDPGVRARLMIAMAEAYRGLEEHRKAIDLFEDALPLLREKYGDDSPELMDGLNEFGNVANQLQDYPTAKRYFEAALPIAEGLRRSDPAFVATILKNLGDSEINLKDYDAARGHLERALDIRKRVYGPENIRTAKVASSLATLFSETGDYPQAIEMARRSLEIRQATSDPVSSSVGYGQYFLGSIEYDAGDYAAAATAFESARSIFGEIQGADGLMVAESLLGLAKVRHRLTDAEESYSFYLQARAIHEAVLDPEDPQTAGSLARTLERYAEFLEDLGRSDEAGSTRATADDLRERHHLSP